MLTYKLKIIEADNINLIVDYQNRYSFAFRKMFKNSKSLKNKEFKNRIKKEFKINDYIYWSIVEQIETKIKQIIEFKNQNIKKQESIKKELEICIDKTLIFKLNSKLQELENSLSKDIVFGGKQLLKQISFLSNNKELNKDKIEKLKQEYKDKRLLPIYLHGCALYTGNEKVDFYLQENKIIFKPTLKEKSKIFFKCSKKQKSNLTILQNLINNTKIPISVYISTKYINLAFDEELLNGFAFDTTRWSKELSKIPKENKKERTRITKKYYHEQEERKLKNKKRNRYLAVDLNPQYIGWCVCDKLEGKIEIIAKGCYDLSNLSIKLKLSSEDIKQIYQTNKRKYEISIVWKDLFKKAIHYKVAYFVCEELKFKQKTINQKNREFNRKTKNIWHRTLTNNLINKYCNSFGIQKIEVNPIYSSFIGNVQHNFFDPVSASLEICRRGLYKFEKGKFFPELTSKDLDTMSNLIKNQVRDVQDMTESNSKNILSLSIDNLTWPKAFNFFKSCKYKYRNSLNNFKEFRLKSIKSNVLFYNFS
jgi:IS605 OrfB family transposase